MKKIVNLCIALFLLYCSFTSVANSNNMAKTTRRNNLPVEHSFRIQCTPDVYEITKTFAAGYTRLHPEVAIEVVPMNDLQGSDVLPMGADLTFVSDKYSRILENGPKWNMVIGYEILVPVISSKNPFINEINRHGIRSGELAGTMKSAAKATWGSLLGNDQKAPVHYYIINDGSLKEQVAEFMKADPGNTDAYHIVNSADFIFVLQKDPYGIVFCRMTDLLNSNDQGIAENIKLLPFDKNGNGQLDDFEKIYNDLNVFARGVWIGKYPQALGRTIYSVSSAKPENGTVTGFLAWMITAGQKCLYPVGYQNFAYSDWQVKNLAMLRSSQAEVSEASSTGFFSGKLNTVSLVSFILIVLIPFVLIFMITDGVLRHKRQQMIPLLRTTLATVAGFDENFVEVPQGLFFDKSHMWAFMEKDGLVRIGLDDFLQHITGSLTGIKMKEPGEKVQKGEQLISIIQNGKHLTINAPISGTIKANNALLLSNASAINSSPYSDGWVCMIEPSRWLNEIRFLIMAEMYREWLKKEFARVKDFFAASLKPDSAEFAHIILQDGGTLKDGVLADLGPMVWEDFQTNFMERSK
jgi:glycine cleavage system H lipoate-binding protein